MPPKRWMMVPAMMGNTHAIKRVALNTNAEAVERTELENSSTG
jgi:hypothetical protein